MNELLKISALALAERISQREISPTEVLEAHIAQIEKVNPSLNAMVEDDFTRARKKALEQTEQLAKRTSELPPLYGVPFTVKEMFAYEGMKRTGGNIHHRNDVMTSDATVVARLKNAGAIPMCTTNVPELGFWFETHNPIYGRTNNPYDLSRTCGGSSGGEAALIGAGASPFGIGSDIGGSIRMPASFCGIFGHKPSRYYLPLTGHFPYQADDFKTNLKYPYTSSGPLSRRAQDLYPLMKILMGKDPQDPSTLDVPLKERPRQWAGRKVLICPSPIIHGTRRVDDELSQAVRNCGSLFEQLGASVVELAPRFFLRAPSLWFAALKSTQNKHLYEMLIGDSGSSLSVGKELLLLAFGKGRYTLPNLAVSLAEILETGSTDPRKDLAALEKMKLDLDEYLGEDGILIFPMHSRVAPKHRAPLMTPLDFIYTGIFTTLGYPATSVPMGLNEEGLPLGVQVISRHGNDHITLGCAEFLETTFGGWQPPKIFS